MEAIYYLFISLLLGMTIVKKMLIPVFEKKENIIWYLISAGFGVGVLVVTWMVYLIAWFFSVCLKMEEPLFLSNIIVLGVISLFYIMIFWRNRNKKAEFFQYKWICNRKRLKKEVIFYGLLGLFTIFIMWFVFFVKDGVMYSGYTVFGDYAPHTAMIRSFSLGNNFPTQYPHFGGEDVKYHFMFQFLTGNLEYLGMRIDFAYNIVSAMSLWGFLVVLTRICLKVSGSLWAGFFAILCFMFRSGTAFFRFLYEHMQNGDLLNTLKENTAFIGYTPNENWGLWNFNVYLNQRHLAFGLLIVSIMICIFIEWLEKGTSYEENGSKWLLNRICTVDAWKCKNIKKAMLCGIILGLCSFWNGAAVIGGLLILAGFAIFSDGKLDYAIMAGITILLSQLQSKLFVDGSVMDLKVWWGFICEDKSFPGVFVYLIHITGIAVVGLLFYLFFTKRINRCMVISMAIPIVFAFTISLTPDVTVNHKYIMISYAFMTIFWGDILFKLLQGKILKKFVAFILALCLTIAGIYDFVLVVRGNSGYRRVTVNLESNLLRWLENTVTKDDLILTPEYSMNEITMSGAMLYCGWPYYAWSAGYDTYYRADIGKKIYSTQDQNELRQLVAQEKITYIIFEEDSTFEGVECNEEIIKNTYQLATESDDGRIRVYRTDKILE